jgi:hypothetical protein
MHCRRGRNESFRNRVQRNCTCSVKLPHYSALLEQPHSSDLPSTRGNLAGTASPNHDNDQGIPKFIREMWVRGNSRHGQNYRRQMGGGDSASCAAYQPNQLVRQTAVDHPRASHHQPACTARNAEVASNNPGTAPGRERPRRMPLRPAPRPDSTCWQCMDMAVKKSAVEKPRG